MAKCTCGNETNELISLDKHAKYLEGMTVCRACIMHNDKSAVHLASKVLVKMFADEKPFVEKPYDRIKNITNRNQLEIGKDYLLKADKGGWMTVRWFGGKDNMFFPYDQTREHHHRKGLFEDYNEYLEEFTPPEHKEVGLCTFKYMNFGGPMDFVLDRMVNASYIEQIEFKEKELIDWGGKFD